MQKIITVFGSSFPQPGDIQYEFALELGKKLSENNFAVCTGGYAGIMEAVSRGAFLKGGTVYGVTLEFQNIAPNKFLSVEIKSKTLFERINKLIEIGNAFVILQGGTGTLLELSAVWELINKNLIPYKPIICHSSLWEQVVNLVNQQLKYENKRTDLVDLVNNIDEIITLLKLKLKF